METKEIKKTDPVSNGDKLILTYNILNPFQMFAGLLNPVAIGTQKDEAVIKMINSLKAKSGETGFVVDDYSVDENKLKIRVTVFDKSKLRPNKGLGVEPVTTVATAVIVAEYISIAIVVVAVAWGVSVSLKRIEKITSNPIPALAILGVVVIFLVRELGFGKKQGAGQ